MPKTFGRRRSLCFICQPSYWGCCSKSSSSKARIGIVTDHESEQEGFDSVDKTFQFETVGMNPQCYEKLTPEFDSKEASKSLLKVSGLHKEYENGFKAVNGINVKLY